MSHLLHNLTPAQGARHKEKRIGRGEGSGHGGTATRGHKGDKSRSGYRLKRGFEGGQMPFQRRIPKFGFRNPFRVEYFPLNLDRLEAWVQADPNLTEITPDWLYDRGIVRKGMPIKVLARGKLTKPLTVHAHRVSAAAQAAIEQVGGKVVLLPL